MKFLFAGHNRSDPGAVYNGVKEADLTIELRNLIVKELKKRGHSVVIDSDFENNTQLQSRIRPGAGSVLLDLHFNASANADALGSEAIISNNANLLSKKFAIEMVEGICKILYARNRGVKSEIQTAHKKIGIVNTAAGISCLAEICFLSNVYDMAKYQLYKNKVAEFLAELLIKYDNLQ